MIHTFAIEEFEDPMAGTTRYRARCDTCGEPVHVEHGIVQRDLAVLDAKQHARIAHDARDVAGNDTAWERIPERRGRWVRHPELESDYARSVGAIVEIFEEEEKRTATDGDRFVWSEGDITIEKA